MADETSSDAWIDISKKFDFVKHTFY